MAEPTVTSLDPSGGVTSGGTLVEIVGTGFTGATAVAFGGTAAADYAVLSDTKIAAVSPAGSAAIDYVVVTTPEGSSGETSGALWQWTDGLFTVAEARAYDKLQLAAAEDFSDAAIIAHEELIREFLTGICGVDFLPTAHADEYHSGDGGQWLVLDWPLVTSVTSIGIRSDSTWTDLTSEELEDVHIDEASRKALYRESGAWPSGVRNIKVTYTAGYAAVPKEIKDAALKIAVSELPPSNVPFAASSWDGAGVGVSFMLGDGYGDRWHRIPEVQRAYRRYSRRSPGFV